MLCGQDSPRGRRFGCKNELKSAVNEVLKAMSKDWFEEGIKKVAECWRKCIELQGDIVKNKLVLLFRDSLF